MTRARAAVVPLVVLALACGEEDDRATPSFEAAATVGRCASADTEASGVVWGRVSEDDSIPLEAAQVYLPDAPSCGTLTDAAGRYVLEGVPAGEHEISFLLIGYDAGSATITVRDDTVHASARLRPTRIQLDDLIIQPSTEPPDTSTTGSPDTSEDGRPR